MIILVNVEIGNNLDDCTRNEILACDSEDTNVLNNLSDMVDMFVNLDKWSDEYICRFNIIKPKNISSDVHSSDLVDSVFN